jgi:hypothetical protein
LGVRTDTSGAKVIVESPRSIKQSAKPAAEKKALASTAAERANSVVAGIAVQMQMMDPSGADLEPPSADWWAPWRIHKSKASCPDCPAFTHLVNTLSTDHAPRENADTSPLEPCHIVASCHRVDEPASLTFISLDPQYSDNMSDPTNMNLNTIFNGPQRQASAACTIPYSPTTEYLVGISGRGQCLLESFLAHIRDEHSATLLARADAAALRPIILTFIEENQKLFKESAVTGEEDWNEDFDNLRLLKTPLGLREVRALAYLSGQVAICYVITAVGLRPVSVVDKYPDGTLLSWA